MNPISASRRLLTRGLLVLGVAGLLASCATPPVSTPPARSAEIRVITSGAFTEAYKLLVPEFEKASGHKVISSFGASMGNAPDAIPTRLARGEKFDVIILYAGPALDQFIRRARRRRIARGSGALDHWFRGEEWCPEPDISTAAQTQTGTAGCQIHCLLGERERHVLLNPAGAETRHRRSGAAEEQTHPERARRHRRLPAVTPSSACSR